MGVIRVVDKMPEFVRQNANVMDRAMERMARDILMVANISVPFKTGELQKSGDIERSAQMSYKVWFREEYAAFQERGSRADGSHYVRKYTTPGTGRAFLLNGAQTVGRDTLNYLKQAANNIRLGL